MTHIYKQNASQNSFSVNKHRISSALHSGDPKNSMWNRCTYRKFDSVQYRERFSASTGKFSDRIQPNLLYWGGCVKQQLHKSAGPIGYHSQVQNKNWSKRLRGSVKPEVFSLCLSDLVKLQLADGGHKNIVRFTKLTFLDVPYDLTRECFKTERRIVRNCISCFWWTRTYWGFKS